ncbi:MAG: PSD1 and planctomycete cytochrome C domain-containing protein [Bacteroidota bacterium]
MTLKKIKNILVKSLGLMSLICYLCNCQTRPTSDGNISKLVEKEQSIPDKIDFNFHVKPILSDRCFACHGPDKNAIEGDLSLATREDAMKALGKYQDRHAIVPGLPDSSTMIQRIYSDDPEDVMPTPESNLTLNDYEKEILKKWIEQGAEWKKHWSFLPPEESEIPQVQDKDWVKNEIDNFVLAKLENSQLTPNAPAEKEKLLRRLSFDLTGLPPTIEELDAFIADESPDAFEKQVDRLLASNAFAEQMATHWLDLSRYADSHGYQDDLERIAWPWRDWVIHAYKKNMPYDEFVTWQLAGDLLPNANREQIIATAFNRNHKITQEGGVIGEEYRTEYVADRAQTFSVAFLGLTMECARCHDHKYDPLSQKNYFELFSFFNNVPENGQIEPYGAIPEPYIKLTKKEIDEVLTFINNVDTLEEIPLMVMQEMEQPRQAHILNRGLYDQPTTPVEPNTPEAVFAFDKEFEQNRKGLAEWLFDEQNPLTARVAANRLWQQMFGTGLVATSDDFGNQGALPSHPELLDNLAIKFREEGWNIRAMLKMMAMSATYQQSSKTSPELLEMDPENRLLARASRLRLSAEMIRDHALTISGLLSEEVGGPSVKPYQPDGLWAETIGGGGGSLAKYVMDEGTKLYRRSLYTFWKRTVPPPSMMIFDASTRDLCTVKRQSTSTPLQALVLMNDPQIIEAARVVAQSTLIEKEAPKERIETIFQLATSRRPTDEEVQSLEDYLQEELQYFESAPEKAEEYLSIGEYTMKVDEPTTEVAAYAMLASTIFNLEESFSRG